MDKQQIIDKLTELGIVTSNVYPKSSFVRNGDVHIGLFKREMNEDFYFFNTFNKKIYQFLKPKDIESYQKDVYLGNTKYLIPLYECNMIWEDKVYVELPDEQYNKMTLRQYAAIQLRVPQSGLEWLDIMINESNKEVDAVGVFSNLLSGR